MTPRQNTPGVSPWGSTPPPETSRIRPPVVLLLFLAVFLVGVAVGKAEESFRSPPRSPSTVADGELPGVINTGLFREMWDILHEKYVGEVRDEDLATGVLRGLVTGLGDPYSSYADPEEAGQFSEEISGSFSGVGIEISERSGLVTVIAPLDGSPAERAGIKAKDIIVSVDEEDVTRGMSLTEVVSKIRGPAGTEVTLGIVREQRDEPLEIRVRRESIRLESVSLRVEEEVGVIRLSAFHEDTPRRFRRVVRDLLSARVRGIVLDMRNNPGGVLASAVAIGGHFVPEGELLVREVPANPENAAEHRAAGPADLAHLPVVVLVNGGSASASEILAAALRDVRRAPIVGERTFGKGSVQELIGLSDGSSLRVTIAKWIPPSGEEVPEEGLAPDVEVEDPTPDDEVDEMMERAKEMARVGGRAGE